MRWNSLGFHTVKEAVDYHTDGKADELLNTAGNYPVQNAALAASWLRHYAEEDARITIVGDYDCDGICASAAMKIALEDIGATNVHVRLPRRMSEGYGMKPHIVEEIPYGVIVTVDNGIAAHEAIELAKKKGLVVIVTDHHMPVIRNGDIVLPKADLIVDPHIDDSLLSKNGKTAGTVFHDYCGAGLVYKIACCMGVDPMALARISAFAAIATVADVMPLLGDNRNIYHEGIKSIRQRDITAGLQMIVDVLKSGNIVTEGNIGFKIAPMLNAPGRLLDDGAKISLDLVLSDSFLNGRKLLDQVQQLNENRKDIKEECVKYALAYMEQNNVFGVNPAVIVDRRIPEGIIGLVAGEITEDYEVSSFCFTEKDGNLKGSARACEEDDMKACLDRFDAAHPGVLLGYGGHPGAAGLTIRKDGLEEFRNGMREIMSKAHPKKDVIDYDLEISPSEIGSYAQQLAQYVPFGEKNPPLIFRVNGFRCAQMGLGHYAEIQNGRSVRMNGAGFEVVGFDLAQQYHDEKEPEVMDVVGKIAFHYFNGNCTPQVEMLDFHPSHAA